MVSLKYQFRYGQPRFQVAEFAGLVSDQQRRPVFTNVFDDVVHKSSAS